MGELVQLRLLCLMQGLITSEQIVVGELVQFMLLSLCEARIQLWLLCLS